MACWLCGFETPKLSTDANAPMCKNGPCQICIAVTEVDEEINRAVATLRRLMSKRCDLRSEQNRVHGTLIHRLPIELKNHIFELLLPSRDQWGVIHRTERTVMRSFLTSISVCRGWRDIAFSNPFLWSTMHIQIGTSNASSRIDDWILRSRTLPINCHIEVGKRGSEKSRNALMDAMIRYFNRLQSLSLVVSDCAALKALQCSKVQYHRLTQLRLISFQPHDQSNLPLSLLNPTASPEKIELGGVSLRSLQISWNRLTSAKLDRFDMEDLIHLFQHASQMTSCQILSPKRGPDNFSMPHIIHHKLKSLHLLRDVPRALLGSLTLPCLQELDTVVLAELPAFMRRSSCPLTSLTLSRAPGESLPFDELQPLPGVTDLVVGRMGWKPDVLKRLLLEGYFPDLRHLTLRPQPFWILWENGVIPLLLDRKRPRPGESNVGRLHKILVVDCASRFADFDEVLNSDIGEQLKALNISMREDGFEFL